MLKRNVLICSELYCDGEISKNRSNTEHNLIKTFDATQINYHLHTLHIDEAVVVYNSHIDNVLVDYCKKWDIKIVIFSLIGGSSYNPSFETYRKLKELGIYLCFQFPDCGQGWGLQTIRELGDLSDLNINWDLNSLIKVGENPKLLSLPAPQDISQFCPQENQDIDVSFIGSTTNYQDRQYYLSNLINHIPNLVIRGGQRQEALTPAAYSQLIRRSKISLNFSVSLAQFFQVKGRVWEVLACGSLLMEMKNPCTSRLLIPGEDYIEFENLEDLINKINYYLTHEEERARIAASGHKKYMENYSAFHFWRAIMNRIEEDLKKNIAET